MGAEGAGLKNGTGVFHLPRRSGCSTLRSFYLQKSQLLTSSPCAREDRFPPTVPPRSQKPLLPCLGSLWPHQEKRRMAYEKSADIFDISRSMFKYPWPEYPERTKGEARIDRNRVRGGA